jgi:hypothetical protein
VAFRKEAVATREEAAATRAAIDARAKAQRRTNTWLMLSVASVAVLVALVLVIQVQNRQRSAQTREVIRYNAALSAQIVDCTTVGGDCYEQSQQRTRAIIAQLVETNKAIAQCARTADTSAELDECVNDRVGPAPTPQPANR